MRENKKKIVGSNSVMYETNAISCFAWAHHQLRLYLNFHSIRAPAYRVSNREPSCISRRKLLGLYGYGTRAHRGDLLFVRKIKNDFHIHFVNIPEFWILGCGFFFTFLHQIWGRDRYNNNLTGTQIERAHFLRSESWEESPRQTSLISSYQNAFVGW